MISTFDLERCGKKTEKYEYTLMNASNHFTILKGQIKRKKDIFNVVVTFLPEFKSHKRKEKSEMLYIPMMK